jgi:hypothetical protein
MVNKMGSLGEASESTDSEAVHAPGSNTTKRQCLLDWNVNVLKRLLQKIIAMRNQSVSPKRFLTQFEKAANKTGGSHGKSAD